MNSLQREQDSPFQEIRHYFHYYPSWNTSHGPHPPLGQVHIGEKRHMGAGETQKGPSKKIDLGQVARKQNKQEIRHKIEHHGQGRAQLSQELREPARHSHRQAGGSTVWRNTLFSINCECNPLGNNQYIWNISFYKGNICYRRGRQAGKQECWNWFVSVMITNIKWTGLHRALQNSEESRA